MTKLPWPRNTRFAETCTAIGFILWLTIFALSYVYIFRITRWHAALLVLSAPFIAYAVNILRAFTLVLNPAMEILTIHTLQGIAFFLIGFSLLYTVDKALMRFFDDNSGKHKKSFIASGDHAVAARKQEKLYVLITIFTAFLIRSFFIPKWSAPPTTSYPPVSLSDEFDGMETYYHPAFYIYISGSVRYSSTLFASIAKTISKYSCL